MGVVTVTQPPYGAVFQNLGQRYWTGPLTITMSASYATGGDTITPQQLGFGSVIDAMLGVAVSSASFVGPFWLFLLNTVTAGSYTIQAFGTAAGATGLTEAGAGAAGINNFVFSAVFVGV